MAEDTRTLDHPAKRMTACVHNDLGLWPRKLIGDTGYGSADMLAWLVNERDIEPHLPVFDHSSRSNGIFERAAFVFDHDRDQYDCPGGKPLKRARRSDAVKRDSGTALLPMAFIVTEPASSTAMVARSNRAAVRALRHERSCDTCTRAPATLPVCSPRKTNG